MQADCTAVNLTWIVLDCIIPASAILPLQSEVHEVRLCNCLGINQGQGRLLYWPLQWPP